MDGQVNLKDCDALFWQTICNENLTNYKSKSFWSTKTVTYPDSIVLRLSSMGWVVSNGDCI